mmetsp:Transcript_74330/g.207675  ORF Transcript_74330/g.207675 Transcript_74330/m.207675 type:complete len:261 (-) Transcript_74330:1101-1883(-)
MRGHDGGDERAAAPGDEGPRAQVPDEKAAEAPVLQVLVRYPLVGLERLLEPRHAGGLARQGKHRAPLQHRGDPEAARLSGGVLDNVLADGAPERHHARDLTDHLPAGLLTEGGLLDPRGRPGAAHRAAEQPPQCEGWLALCPRGVLGHRSDVQRLLGHRSALKRLLRGRLQRRDLRLVFFGLVDRPPLRFLQFKLCVLDLGLPLELLPLEIVHEYVLLLLRAPQPLPQLARLTVPVIVIVAQALQLLHELILLPPVPRLL